MNIGQVEFTIAERGIRDQEERFAERATSKEDDVPVEKADSHDHVESQEEQSSPIEVLQQVSEETVRAAGDALQNVYYAGPNAPVPQHPAEHVHRRSQSDIGSWGHRRSNSFQRLKVQMQKAWPWGSSSREEDCRPSFNPEILANQKRQWYQLHSKTSLDQTNYKEPTSLFEHFVIVGLHPDANLESVELAYAKRKRWEMEMAKSEIIDFKLLQHRGPSLPILEHQILFKYPPGKKLAVRPKDLATFCFPGGVKAQLPERTPSLSDLNVLVYGQEHLGKDDSSFIFSLKVADNETLYGVCLHVSEMVQRPPGILSPSTHLHSSGGRFLVSAPRCYCMLTRVPFFELHFEMLNSIIAQERLNRITEFTSEMSLTTSGYATKQHKQNKDSDSSSKEYYNDLMTSAIPVRKAIALTAAAAGIITDDEIQSPSPKATEPQSPEKMSPREASNVEITKEKDRGCGKSSHCCDDNYSEALESQSDDLEKTSGNCQKNQASPDIGNFFSSRSRTLEPNGSVVSLLSQAVSITSEEEEDENLSSNESDFSGELLMGWAKENKNELLQIVCGYHAIPLPPRGSKVVFHPLEHLQAIEYNRLPVSAFGFSEEYLASFEASQVNSELAAAEEAHSLSIWTTATVCRALSLESILALVAGVILEKQVVVVCPNLGILSATVLSLIPIIRPFQWQSLMLPVLPGNMLDFLDAPVPFLVGIQQKPVGLKIKTSNLIQVNVMKDQLKMCHLPALPRIRELIGKLSPLHARMSYQSSAAKRQPVYRCSEVQAEAATKFLAVMRRYFESFCSDLRSHTITSVQSDSDRVSLLLKDSFIDSFPSRDQPFIKLLVETQLFSVLSDNRLASFEHG